MLQTFLSFQWDIFLLETGAATLLYAPLTAYRATTPLPAAAWLLRVLFVKFMTMSAVTLPTPSHSWIAALPIRAVCAV